MLQLIAYAATDRLWGSDTRGAAFGLAASLV